LPPSDTKEDWQKFQIDFINAIVAVAATADFVIFKRRHVIS